jgi:uncharacterized Zn-finger protein
LYFVYLIKKGGNKMGKTDGQKIYKYSCGHGEFAWFPPENKDYEEWIINNSLCDECYKKYYPAKEPAVINMDGTRYYNISVVCPYCGNMYYIKLKIINYDYQHVHDDLSEDRINTVCSICDYEFNVGFLLKEGFEIEK